MGIQIKVVGTLPQGNLVAEMQWAFDTAQGADGVVIVGPAINLQYPPHLQLVVNAAASLGRSGCQRVAVQWAVPF